MGSMAVRRIVRQSATVGGQRTVASVHQVDSVAPIGVIRRTETPRFEAYLEGSQPIYCRSLANNEIDLGLIPEQ